MSMFRWVRRAAVGGVVIVAALGARDGRAELPSYGVGRTPTTPEVNVWDLTIPFDGEALPPGSGTAALGKPIYLDRCAACHGDHGEDRKYGALVGGHGTLPTDKPLLTIGSFWQYAPTLWSYIRRSQPVDEPGSLSAHEVYAVTAYLLYLNGIIGEQDVLDARTLPQIKMPNRDGFVPDPRPDVGQRSN